MQRNIAGILEIGNHPPPVCGWSIQTTLVKQELSRRGFPVSVLNIGENRKRRSDEYVDVQNGLDLFEKLVRFSARGYRFHIHFNGHSKKGLVLACAAGWIGAALGPNPVLTFHGGVRQELLLEASPLWAWMALRSLFRLGACVTCDSEEVRREILDCTIGLDVRPIPCVSAELLKWNKVEIPAATSFMDGLEHVFFSYVRLRPEYDFEVLLEAMRLCMERNSRVGFIWMGPSERELSEIERIIRRSRVQLERVLLLPNAEHDQFLSTMVRCSATIRAHECDGVCASVLESLALGVPVIASDDGRRPAGVITYKLHDAIDLYRKMIFVLDQHEQVCAALQSPEIGHNTDRLVEALLRS